MRFGLSEEGGPAAIYGAGGMCGLFLDWYRKQAGEVRADVVIYDSWRESEGTAYGYPVRPAAKLRPGMYQRIIIAVREQEQEKVKEVISRYAGSGQRTVCVRKSLLEERMEYDLAKTTYEE